MARAQNVSFLITKLMVSFFFSIFVVGGTNFWIMKIGFLAFFEAKMTKIVILDQKLIVPKDYPLICLSLQIWSITKIPSSGPLKT